MTPKRIQRKRTKGWRLPPNTVCVTRPTRYGNPFYVRDFAGGKVACVEHFRQRVEKIDRESNGEIRKIARRELGGKDLACWCPLDEPCHADVWLEIANS